MRLAHLSDLHFYAFPSVGGIPSKRLLGLANLYIKGRIHHFSPDIARQAIASVVAQNPDAVVISGDLTALASPREFELAREALEPILSRFPTVIIPGNHDYYTRGAAREDRIERYFGEFIRTPGVAPDAPSYPSLHLVGDVAIIGMNPNRAHLGSSGKVKTDEIERLDALLQRPEVQDRFRVLVIHYPLLNREGIPTKKFWRRLENREPLVELLMKRPVGLILHGHDHLRYLNHLHPEGHPVTFIYNSGSGAFARGFDYPIPASFNVYEIVGRRLERVVHMDFGPEGFHPTYDGPPSLERLETPAAHGASY